MLLSSVCQIPLAKIAPAPQDEAGQRKPEAGPHAACDLGLGGANEDVHLLN